MFFVLFLIFTFFLTFFLLKLIIDKTPNLFIDIPDLEFPHIP